MNRRYLKVMFGNISGADNSLEYKIDEENVTSFWNPSSNDPKEMGGFNFSVEDKIIRWLVEEILFMMLKYQKMQML